MAKQNLSKMIPLTLGVLAMAFLIGIAVFAWTEPTVGPPGGNVDAPINVGTNDQTKVGGLTIEGILRAGSGAYQLVKDGLSLAFKNNAGTTKMIIGDDGNVGIGITNPGAKLDVYSSDPIKRKALIVKQTATPAEQVHGAYITAEGSDAGLTNVGGYFSASGGSLNYALVTGSGNVGIGMDSPQGKFVIHDNFSLSGEGLSNALSVYANNTNGSGIYSQQEGATSYAGYFKGGKGVKVDGDLDVSGDIHGEVYNSIRNIRIRGDCAGWGLGTEIIWHGDEIRASDLVNLMGMTDGETVNYFDCFNSKWEGYIVGVNLPGSIYDFSIYPGTLVYISSNEEGIHKLPAIDVSETLIMASWTDSWGPSFIINKGILRLVPLDSVPSGIEGRIYANKNDHHLYYYNGTSWKQLD